MPNWRGGVSGLVNYLQGATKLGLKSSLEKPKVPNDYLLYKYYVEDATGRTDEHGRPIPVKSFYDWDLSRRRAGSFNIGGFGNFGGGQSNTGTDNTQDTEEY